MIHVDPDVIATLHTPAELSKLVQDLADKSGFTPEQITGQRRIWPLVQVRQYGMLLARQAGFSLSQIGRAFGGRDHTTVIHGVRTAAARMKVDLS